MSKILNLIIKDRSDLKDPNEFVESFEIGDGVYNPEKAIREAIKEFVISGTNEAKAALSYACGGFNWGNAVSNIPVSLFIKHGLTPLKHETINVFVDHDEILTSDVTDEPALVDVRKLIKEHIEKGKRSIAYWTDGNTSYADEFANKATERNEKLMALLVSDDINEQSVYEQISSETDDELVVIYENVLDYLLS